jgi:hypothetical protein
MNSLTDTLSAPPESNPPASKRPSGGKRYKRALTIAVVVVLLLLATGAGLIAVKWPFTPDKVRADLEDATSGSVQIHGFQATYFPPGCVMEGVELRPAGHPGGPPLVTAGRLTIRANYRGLFGQRIEVIRLENVRVDMGQREALRSGHSQGGHGSSTDDSTSIAEIIVDGGIVEFPRKEKPPLQFKIHQLTLGNIVSGKPRSFHATLDNPLPPGHVSVDGQFGPWNASDIGATPLSGAYAFRDAKLGSLAGVAGTLSSQGSFAGPAKALRVQGTTDTPNFEVKSVAHPVHLRTEFQVMVNCTNGDVDLQSIRGHFEKTTFGVAGDVSEKTNAHSRVATLRVADPEGRIDDWLRLLAPDQTPQMTGPISFQAQVTVPGGPRPFMQRIRIRGDFGLSELAFTKEKTQHGASELSLRAQGQKVPDAQNEVLSKITGKLATHVELLDGVAHFSNLTYTLPGAVANMHGTYSFNDKRIDLHGELRVDTKFSKTASGAKALLTRAAEGLLAKGTGKGEILPVKLTGTYGHASYGLDK